MPPLQAVESLDVTTTREVVTLLAAVQPHEELRPLVVPIGPLAPEVPVPANFVSPSPVVESGRDDLGTNVPVEAPTVSDVSKPGVPSLALNDFADSLPLINLPGETSEVEAPSLTTNLASEVVQSFDVPVSPSNADVPLTLPELSPTISPSTREVVSTTEPVTPGTPLSISRYAEDLPLPAPIAPRDDAPSVDVPMVAPLPALNAPEEIIAPFELLPLGEVAQDLAVTPSPIDQSPIDQLPVDSSTSDEPTAVGEPALSISRYVEDMPLIDLDFGWNDFEPETVEPSFEEATSQPTEALPSLAMPVPDRPLPSIGARPKRADRVGARPERTPISISRFSSDLPLNRSTTLNQVTQIQRFSLGSLTQNLPSLGGVTDNLPSLGGLAQNVPSLGGLAENLPSLGGLTDNLPSLGGLAESIGGQLPQMPSLGGLASSQMPLPPSINDALGGLGGAGQEALGQITSMAPSMPELPAMPQLPNIEKLTDQVWREIQRKLKVERERTRGLA